MSILLILQVQLRSTEVVPMLFRVLETADVGLQKEVLKLILVLCSSNPANTKVPFMTLLTLITCRC